MTLVVMLDSGPLGLVTQPKATAEGQRCEAWLETLLTRNERVIVPEIIDYELRRELLRGGKTAGIERLDALVATLQYEPLTTEIMRLAASFWAQTRRRGRPTAADLALDIDMILAAQAKTLEERYGDTIIIATANVRHLALFAAASPWDQIT